MQTSTGDGPEPATLARAHLAFLFAALFVSGTDTVLAFLGPLAWAPLLVMVALLCVPWPRSMGEPLGARLRLRPPSAREAAIGLLVCAPAAGYLALTSRQDFPFLGDTDWHLVHAQYAPKVWTQQLLALPFALAAYWAASRVTRFRYLPVVALALVVAVSAAVRTPIIARYPSGFYFLSLPFTVVARVLDLESPVDACRLLNVLAVPAWAFVLRPLLLGRYPDLRMVPGALFLFWQKDVVHYLTSSYLEPWAAVLCLVAAEGVLRPNENAEWLPTLAAGAAAMVKETAALIVPFVWVASHWGALRKREVAAPLVNGAVAVLPFAVYLQYRARMDVKRGAALAPLDVVLSAARARELASLQVFHFGWLGLAVLGGVVILALSRRRPAEVCILGACLAQIAFFHADVGSVAFTGYFRFELLWLALLAACLLTLDRWLLPAAAVAGLASAVPLVGAYHRAIQANPARNFFEWKADAPIFFPIRPLFEAAGPLDGVDRVRMVFLDRITMGGYFAWHVNRIMPLAYPRLARRFRFRLVRGGPCTCDESGEAILVLPTYVPPDSLAEPRGAEDRQRALLCAQVVRATCRSATVKRMPDGSLTGILAWGRASP